MTKTEKIQKERARMDEIFKNLDPEKQGLISGLIDDAAFLFVENEDLKSIMIETGMIKYHPIHKEMQKPIESAKQYRQNANTYAVIIKTLNGILSKDQIGEEDGFDEFIRKRNEDKVKPE